MSKRVILHSDLNNFYATVEIMLNPALKNKAVAVCGDEKQRHGIVLAKNELAKKCGIKTGEVIWQAKKKCADLIIVGVHMDKYIYYSKKVKKIYARFTDYIESFGIDECWLDVTHSGIFGDGESIANKIREAVKEELGLTVSVGVSFNKAFAKLASDLKKPDAVTIINEENFKEVVYPLPVEDLLFIGAKTKVRLNNMNIMTIGDLATTDDRVIVNMFGKNGLSMLNYARGKDTTEVSQIGFESDAKSIGNSLTYFEDVIEEEDIKRLIFMVTESVASRLKESGLGKASVVHLYLKDKNLNGFGCQKKVQPTALCSEIAQHAFALYKLNYPKNLPIRSVGVTVTGFSGRFEQLTIDSLTGNYEKKAKVEEAVEKIRNKHGYDKLQRAIMYNDKKHSIVNIKADRLEHNNKPADLIGHDDDYIK